MPCRQRSLRHVLLALLWPGLVAADPAPLVLRTVSQPSNPMKYDLQNTSHPGVCIEVLRAIEAIEPGLKFSGLDQQASVPRIEVLLEENQIDVFCTLLKSQRRASRFHFIGPPIYPVFHRIAVRADDPIDIKTMEELRRLGADELILVSKGTKFEERLNAHGGLHVDNSSSETVVNLRKLLARRGRFYYFSESALNRAIANESLEGRVRLLPTVFLEESTQFAVARALSPAAVDKLTAALDKLAQCGDLARIYAAYKARH